MDSIGFLFLYTLVAALVGSHVGSNNNVVNEEQNTMVLELIKNQMALTERFMAFLERHQVERSAFCFYIDWLSLG